MSVNKEIDQIKENWKKIEDLKPNEMIENPPIVEEQIHELYTRMVRLWGSMEMQEFNMILNLEGYHDLLTRVRITEKDHQWLQWNYGRNWRSKIKKMYEGNDSIFERRIQYKKELNRRFHL